MAKRAHHSQRLSRGLLGVVVRAWSVVAFLALTLGLILWMLFGIVAAALGTLGRKVIGRGTNAERHGHGSRVSEPDDRRWRIADWMRA